MEVLLAFHMLLTHRDVYTAKSDCLVKQKNQAFYGKLMKTDMSSDTLDTNTPLRNSVNPK